MNIFKHNLASSKRHGLSIIEVLTAMVVALIGVFGVLAMIPFSVQQTQSGLDQDAATSMARNALQSFEAAGYKIASGTNDQLNWTEDAAGTPINAAPTNTLYCIDPLGVTEQGGFGTFNFPFNVVGTMPLTMPSVNLLRPDGLQFDIADARRMFRLTDDVVFKESDDVAVADSDLLGPVQIFNEVAAGGAVSLLNRQSTGAVSWCAVVQPIINNPAAVEIDSYKFNVLVFKDRITDSTPGVEESEMVAATVIAPTVAATPLSSVRIDIALPENVRRNDWVMLINNSDPTLPPGLATNVAFARISNLTNDNKNTPTPDDDEALLTLDGPDFDFGNGTTYLVHLRDVVAVFPRTIKLENVSEWTVN